MKVMLEGGNEKKKSLILCFPFITFWDIENGKLGGIFSISTFTSPSLPNKEYVSIKGGKDMFFQSVGLA